MNRKDSAFSEEYLIMTELIRRALFGGDTGRLDVPDAGALLNEIRQQAVTGFLGSTAGCLNISENEMTEFRSAADRNTFYYLRICLAAETLVEIMQANGIPFAILKGLAAAKYYPDPSVRTMGDVDFIVRPEDFSRAEKVLDEAGFVLSGGVSYRHNSYNFQGISFEMHRRFSRGQGKDETDYLDERIYKAISNAEYCSVSQAVIPVLPDVENGLVLLSHLQLHMVTGIGMRHIVDWVAFVDRVLDDNFWNSEFRDAAEQAGLSQLAEITARMGQLYLGLTENNRTWCMNVPENSARLLAEYVYENGNFGKKSPGKMANALLDVKQTGGFFKSLQYKGLHSGWKAMETYPFLRNFAWLYYGFDYFKNLVRSGTLISTLVSGISKYGRYEELIAAINADSISPDEDD